MSSRRVLIIDDDAAFRFAIGKALRRLGFSASEADGGEAALAELNGSKPPDVALLDLKMRGLHGLDVLRRSVSSPTPIIVLTGHGSVQAAVEAMRLGAFSFLEKPVDAEVLAPLLEQAIHEASGSGHSAADAAGVPPIVGTSAAMDEVRGFVVRVGPTAETVAIYGETGTGKEVVARHLHLASPRRSGPFVAINAACVPRELFESELFGHRRGAFTGATSDQPGRFMESDGGTLFIDEVAELPADCQAKLLRVLESGTIRPLGASREYAVDVRIVVATNRDLWSEVTAGTFREDLYFRLQVFPIVLPPLRDRGEDIAALTQHLLARIGKSSWALDDEAERALEQHHWPGNVRELLNVLRRAVLFAEGRRIEGPLMRKMIAASIFGYEASRAGGGQLPATTTNLAQVERAHIEQVLHALGGNVTQAAVALGIDRRTLQRKLKTFGIH